MGSADMLASHSAVKAAIIDVAGVPKRAASTVLRELIKQGLIPSGERGGWRPTLTYDDVAVILVASMLRMLAAYDEHRDVAETLRRLRDEYVTRLENDPRSWDITDPGLSFIARIRSSLRAIAENIDDERGQFKSICIMSRRDLMTFHIELVGNKKLLYFPDDMPDEVVSCTWASIFMDGKTFIDTGQRIYHAESVPDRRRRERSAANRLRAKVKAEVSA